MKTLFNIIGVIAVLAVITLYVCSKLSIDITAIFTDKPSVQQVI